ncbi:hypothetical protein K438DRAFT_1791220 [Mycena galopus ATCC 62051]|nr:hypothetical protein K438DRAFT_1791220 [Mycena galopus ATCC 62051]
MASMRFQHGTPVLPKFVSPSRELSNDIIDVLRNGAFKSVLSIERLLLRVSILHACPAPLGLLSSSIISYALLSTICQNDALSYLGTTRTTQLNYHVAAASVIHSAGKVRFRNHFEPEPNLNRTRVQRSGSACLNRTPGSGSAFGRLARDSNAFERRARKGQNFVRYIEHPMY